MNIAPLALLLGVVVLIAVSGAIVASILRKRRLSVILAVIAVAGTGAAVVWTSVA